MRRAGGVAKALERASNDHEASSAPLAHLPERAAKVSLHGGRTRRVGVCYNISNIEGIQDTHLHDHDTSAVPQ